jgi:hypothetical protein
LPASAALRALFTLTAISAISAITALAGGGAAARAAPAGRTRLPLLQGAQYIALWGRDVIAVDPALPDHAIAVDRLGRRHALPAFPSEPSPDCASGEPEDGIVVGPQLVAYGDGEVLGAGESACKLGDGPSTEVSYAGPFAGPFAAVALPDGCGADLDRIRSPRLQVSADYIACSTSEGVRATPLTAASGPGVLVPGSHRRGSFALAGRFLALATHVGRSTMVSVVDLRTNTAAAHVRVAGRARYALDDTGVTVVCSRPGGRLQTVSPIHPRPRPLPYRGCTRPFLVRGNRLIFQAAAPGGLIALRRADIAPGDRGGSGSRGRRRVTTLAYTTHLAALIDADRRRVLYSDVDCTLVPTSFLLSDGAPVARPSLRCSATLLAAVVRVERNNVGEYFGSIRLRCPEGCAPSLALGRGSLEPADPLRGTGETSGVFIDDTALVRTIDRYRRARAAARRGHRPPPPPPTCRLRVRVPSLAGPARTIGPVRVRLAVT